MIMKKIDDTGLLLAKFQGDLFEKSVEYLNCSSKYFVKKYMNSDIVKHIDYSSFLYESRDIYNVLDELKNETNLSVGKNKIPQNVMYWIGYLYRYWSYLYNVSSRFLFKVIKTEELVKLYEAYHSLDIEEAINRISESKGIRYFDDVDYQLSILRENTDFYKVK